LGRDPEVRYTPSGAAICNVSIATTRNWKDQNSGEKVEETEWHRVVFYDRLAEIAGEYVTKGSPLLIEGRLKLDTWEKDGKKNSKLRVVGEKMQLLGSRSGGEGGRTGKPRVAAGRGAGGPGGDDFNQANDGYDEGPVSTGGPVGADDDIPF
ncbi:MAG: single-stranded DNA-binding protein, partial [Planctomycetaceae bacterium]